MTQKFIFDSSFGAETIFNDIWISLHEGVGRRSHPFHTPVLVTGLGNEADARTVVLRQADRDQRLVLCHTDIRSPKVSVIKQNPKVVWVCYDRAAKVQLRLYGDARIHSGDELAHMRWGKTSSNSRQCYEAEYAPGTEVMKDYQPPTMIEAPFENFAVIASEISGIDWLYLSAKGHKRIRFDFRKNHWTDKWITP